MVVIVLKFDNFNAKASQDVFVLSIILFLRVDIKTVKRLEVFFISASYIATFERNYYINETLNSKQYLTTSRLTFSVKESP